MHGSPLLLLLYITSSPTNMDLRDTARATYLKPCIKHPSCVYKFFIDVSLIDRTPIEYNHMNESSYDDLQKEYQTYQDIVFKDDCPLMSSRHTDNRVNYGNSAPTYKHIYFVTRNITYYDKKREAVTRNITRAYIPDYKYRRMYKIDWKASFLKWAQANGMIGALFHAFVEDDSFVCTDHVLFQAESYHHAHHQRPFRTGTKLWSGYDDSFSLLSSEVASAFASHYPSSGFNCSHIVDTTSSEVLDKSMWLSWGNSWIHERCNWTNALKETLKMDIIEPSLDCFQSVFSYDKYFKYNGINPYDDNITDDYPCSREPIVYHHAHATKMLLSNRTKLCDICNHMMFIDKIKDPLAIEFIWFLTNNNNTIRYFNYTPVFTHDGAEGWKILLDDYKRSLN